jgi:hypothetical protein
MDHLLDRLGAGVQQLLPLAILLALSGVFWGSRPVAQTPRTLDTAVSDQAGITLLIDLTRQKLLLLDGERLLTVLECTTDPAQHRRLPPGTYQLHHQELLEEQRVVVLAYPSIELAEIGLQQGWIDAREHAAIVEAHRFNLLPPQETALGPAPILCGSGLERARPGEIALESEDIERIASYLQPGTRVVIRP